MPSSAAVADGLKTWDGRHSIDQIEVTVVYFVPQDRAALPDWKDRVEYFRKRIEQFHAREFGGQSTLTARMTDQPFVSEFTTAELRDGDGDFIFFRTLREVDNRLEFGRGERAGYPILLVLSDINWRPLEDFYRLKSRDDGGVEFEGQIIDGRHFPGAASGGARATYLADRGVGWGLVSADGWRVPYSGTDCVVYHEGVGHPIGLPHPQPGNSSVMSLGQYRGWISESSLDNDQKQKLGWQKPEQPARRDDLYSVFRAIPEPKVPQPGQAVRLKCDWPEGARLKSMRVRVQTSLRGPWIELPGSASGDVPGDVVLSTFDRATPVSYRLDVELEDGQTAELWGYFQVREDAGQTPLPPEAAVP